MAGPIAQRRLELAGKEAKRKERLVELEELTQKAKAKFGKCHLHPPLRANSEFHYLLAETHAKEAPQ